MIIALFGQPHSGKSTIANQFPDHVNIDGDQLRKIFANKDYSREGRIKNLNRASDIAHYLNSVGKSVTLSLVYPYKEAREYLNSLTPDVRWVYLHYDGERGREGFHVGDFDKPGDDEQVMQLNTSTMSVEECYNTIYNWSYGEKHT
jgi:GTPase SAR1 family protein